MSVTRTSSIHVVIKRLDSDSSSGYNTNLASLLGKNKHDPLTQYISSVGKEEEFLSFTDENFIISVLESQGFYLMINEVLGLSITIKL